MSELVQLLAPWNPQGHDLIHILDALTRERPQHLCPSDLRSLGSVVSTLRKDSKNSDVLRGIDEYLYDLFTSDLRRIPSSDEDHWQVYRLRTFAADCANNLALENEEWHYRSAEQRALAGNTISALDPQEAMFSYGFAAKAWRKAGDYPKSVAANIESANIGNQLLSTSTDVSENVMYHIMVAHYLAVFQSVHLWNMTQDYHWAQRARQYQNHAHQLPHKHTLHSEIDTIVSNIKDVKRAA